MWSGLGSIAHAAVTSFAFRTFQQAAEAFHAVRSEVGPKITRKCLDTAKCANFSYDSTLWHGQHDTLHSALKCTTNGCVRTRSHTLAFLLRVASTAGRVAAPVQNTQLATDTKCLHFTSYLRLFEHLSQAFQRFLEDFLAPAPGNHCHHCTA